MYNGQRSTDNGQFVLSALGGFWLRVYHPGPMNQSERHPLFSGVTSTSLGTLASRVLGVARESAAAGLLGMSKDGIMDAYVVAFRIPNLFRRLFGEGAMTASYLPVFTEDLERDRRSASRLASAAAVFLAAALVLLTLAAEGICGLLWLIYGDSAGMRLSLGLTATMLPYTVFICLAALAAATLQSLGEFRLPALVPSVLNICWLVGAWFIAPRITADRQGQAYIMAGCVLVGGVLQLLVQLPALRRLGFRFDFDYRESRRSLGRILRDGAHDDGPRRYANQHTFRQSYRSRLRSRPRWPDND